LSATKSYSRRGAHGSDNEPVVEVTCLLCGFERFKNTATATEIREEERSAKPASEASGFENRKRSTLVLAK
jgi:hypothetical protein